MGYRLFSVLFFFCLIGGCAKKTTTTPSTTNPPVGTVDDTAGFYVQHVTASEYTYITHKDASTFTTACKAVEGEAIDCILEAEEADLYYNGAKIQYNIPTTLCTYVMFRPYYYYADRYGTGPTTVQYDVDSTGAIGLDPGNTGTNTGAATGIDCATTPYKFDHSTEAPAGPNCCEGTYTQITRVWDSATSKYVVNAPVLGSWGGLRTNCLDGPAIATQTKTDNGYPKPDFQYVGGSGLNAVYTVASPISLGRGNNVYVANYFEAADHAAGPHPGWPAGSVVGGSDDPTMYYEWTCLDAAAEVKSRIRLQIREWNTKAAFDDRENAPTDHSLTGSETGAFSAYILNDFYDWKDLGNSYPGFKF